MHATGAVGAAPVRAGQREISQEHIIGAVATLLAIIFAVALDGFATKDNLLALARSVSALGILAVGMGTVVIAKGMDLSLVATAGVSTAYTIQRVGDGTPVVAALLIGVAIAVGVGVVNGFLIAYVEIPALFVTLATGLFVYGLFRIILLDGLIADLPSGPGLIRSMGRSTLVGIPVPVIIFAIVAITAHLLLTRSVRGRFAYAQGDNAEAAALTGIGVRPMTIIEYVFAGVVGYVAGLVMAGSVGGFDTQVITGSLIYDVLLVVVLGGISLVGGRGRMLSVVVGTVLIGVMLNGMTILDLNTHQQNIAKGLILLAALVLDNRLHPRDEETVRQGD